MFNFADKHLTIPINARIGLVCEVGEVMGARRSKTGRSGRSYTYITRVNQKIIFSYFIVDFFRGTPFRCSFSNVSKYSYDKNHIIEEPYFEAKSKL